MEDGITAPESGFGPEANLTIQNSYLRNWANINVPTVGSVNGSDNFQVYHSHSSVLPRPPVSCTPITRPGITGLTCPIAPLAGLPAPMPPANLRIVQ